MKLRTLIFTIFIALFSVSESNGETYTYEAYVQYSGSNGGSGNSYNLSNMVLVSGGAGPSTGSGGVRCNLLDLVSTYQQLAAGNYSYEIEWWWYPPAGSISPVQGGKVVATKTVTNINDEMLGNVPYKVTVTGNVTWPTAAYPPTEPGDGDGDGDGDDDDDDDDDDPPECCTCGACCMCKCTCGKWGNSGCNALGCMGVCAHKCSVCKNGGTHQSGESTCCECHHVEEADGCCKHHYEDFKDPPGFVPPGNPESAGSIPFVPFDFKLGDGGFNFPGTPPNPLPPDDPIAGTIPSFSQPSSVNEKPLRYFERNENFGLPTFKYETIYSELEEKIKEKIPLDFAEKFKNATGGCEFTYKIEFTLPEPFNKKVGPYTINFCSIISELADKKEIQIFRLVCLACVGIFFVMSVLELVFVSV